MSSFSRLEYKPVVSTPVPGIGEAGEALAYVRRQDEAIDGPPKDRCDHVGRSTPAASRPALHAARPPRAKS